MVSMYTCLILVEGATYPSSDGAQWSPRKARRSKMSDLDGTRAAILRIVGAGHVSRLYAWEIVCHSRGLSRQDGEKVWELVR